ncbi:hypothetical protein [Nannocystis radixulma]|uniref:Lipoprotein n=1 Tax=Nannocystis radixulma TaxID=2995305 RepID=A0ABT5AYU8_9BACT|nr:hypothetical protein [Nannocystis radixulma]MDC0666398.1 hypothetical protein [Nannocystis radixulma]
MKLHKHTALQSVVAFTAFVGFACDDPNSQTHGDAAAEFVILAEEEEQIEAEGNAGDELAEGASDVDAFEISIEETRDELGNITSLPKPVAGVCDGYNGWNYCYAKCGDGNWYLVGHASVISYGACVPEGDKRCGGWWNHYGSCWGNG